MNFEAALETSFMVFLVPKISSFDVRTVRDKDFLSYIWSDRLFESVSCRHLFRKRVSKTRYKKQATTSIFVGYAVYATVKI